MKKEELKNVLKPIIQECIKELIFEKGFLSSIINEVQGVSAPFISETRQPTKSYQQNEQEFIRKKSVEAHNKLFEHKKKLMEAVGKNSYGGVNIFEGVTPIDEAPAENKKAPSAIEVLDPGNTGGINLNNIPGMGKWGSILKKVNEQKD